MKVTCFQLMVYTITSKVIFVIFIINIKHQFNHIKVDPNAGDEELRTAPNSYVLSLLNQPAKVVRPDYNVEVNGKIYKITIA